MKKVLAIVLAMALVFSFCACGNQQSGQEQGGQKQESGLEVKEVKGVTIPEFKVKVCGAKVTNEDMAAYPIYQVTANTVNSSGTAHSNVYVGFKFTDVMEAAQVTGDLGKATIICTDGYQIEFEGDVKAEGVLLAISKDGTQFKEGPWFAPCTSGTTGDYAQDLSKVEIAGGSSPLASGGSKDEGKKDEGQSGEIAWPQDPVAEDKTDKITFADFSFKINGKEVKNADLAGLKIFRITTTTKNSKDVVSQNKYSGYVLKDVLDKLGIKGSKVTVVADDGYKSELTAGMIANELTIIAIEKDKETGENGTVWVAPCAESAGNVYGKNVVELIVE